MMVDSFEITIRQSFYLKALLIIVIPIGCSGVKLSGQYLPTRQDASSSQRAIYKSEEELEQQIIKRVSPTPPPIAKAAQVTGPVLVFVKIDEEGNVTTAEIISGNQLLRDAARKAALNWKFAPTKINGTPVKVRGNILIRFQGDTGDGMPDKNVEDRELETYRQEAKANPTSAIALCNLGDALNQRDLFIEAIEAYKQAIHVKPDFAKAYEKLADIYYYKHSDYEEAIEICKQLISFAPSTANAYLRLGWSYERLGKYSDAIDIFNQALRNNTALEARHIFYLNLARIYKQEGYKKEAIDANKQLITIEGTLLRSNPNFPEGIGVYLIEIGSLYRQMGQHNEAIEAYRELIKIARSARDVAFAYIEIGVSYKSMKRTQEAIESYKQAAKAMPNMAEAHFALGEIYLDLGDKDSAMKEIDILKVLDQPMANELLKRIRKQ